MAELLTLSLNGWQQIEDAWRRAPDMVREELRAFANAAVSHLTAEVQDRTPVGASGGAAGLRGSIQGEVDDLPDGVLGVVGTSLAHAVPVELGTKPHMPPVQSLEDWVVAKLGVQGKDIRRVAWAVARKIARKGTQGQFMFRDTFEANQAEVQRQFDQTVARIVARL